MPLFQQEVDQLVGVFGMDGRRLYSNRAYTVLEDSAIQILIFKKLLLNEARRLGISAPPDGVLLSLPEDSRALSVLTPESLRNRMIRYAFTRDFKDFVIIQRTLDTLMVEAGTANRTAFIEQLNRQLVANARITIRGETVISPPVTLDYRPSDYVNVDFNLYSGNARNFNYKQTPSTQNVALDEHLYQLQFGASQYHLINPQLQYTYGFLFDFEMLNQYSDYNKWEHRAYLQVDLTRNHQGLKPEISLTYSNRVDTHQNQLPPEWRLESAPFPELPHYLTAFWEYQVKVPWRFEILNQLPVTAEYDYRSRGFGNRYIENDRNTHRFSLSVQYPVPLTELKFKINYFTALSTYRSQYNLERATLLPASPNAALRRDMTHQLLLGIVVKEPLDLEVGAGVITDPAVHYAAYGGQVAYLKAAFVAPFEWEVRAEGRFQRLQFPHMPVVPVGFAGTDYSNLQTERNQIMTAVVECTRSILENTASLLMRYEWYDLQSNNPRRDGLTTVLYYGIKSNIRLF